MNATRLFARALTLTWAVFWLGFGFLSGLAERLGPIGTLMHTVPGVIFLAVPFVAAINLFTNS